MDVKGKMEVVEFYLKGATSPQSVVWPHGFVDGIEPWASVN
jgi:hypothetical protein